MTGWNELGTECWHGVKTLTHGWIVHYKWEYNSETIVMGRVLTAGKKGRPEPIGTSFWQLHQEAASSHSPGNYCPLPAGHWGKGLHKVKLEWCREGANQLNLGAEITGFTRQSQGKPVDILEHTESSRKRCLFSWPIWSSRPHIQRTGGLQWGTQDAVFSLFCVDLECSGTSGQQLYSWLCWSHSYTSSMAGKREMECWKSRDLTPCK